METRRHAEPLRFNELINPILQFQNNKNTNLKTIENMTKYTKAELWQLFNYHFEAISGKKFIQTD